MTSEKCNSLAVREKSGAALIMTLITLSILVILLVGFLSTMLTERRAAMAFEDTERVKLVAAGAVDHAIDLLRTNIPEPARLVEGPLNAPGENWVTNPGRLTVIREGSSPVFIPLHTGEVTELPDAKLSRDAESVDLNQPLPGEITPAITGLAPSTDGSKRPIMRVKWVNLQRDQSLPASKANPLVARYGFWLDDESTRLNINTALGKPAPGKEPRFDAQLAQGFLTPLFTRGTGQVTVSQNVLDWALGRPQSVNLDVLFKEPEFLKHDRLIDHLFVYGYQRHPEAILDFITLKGPDARKWFDESRYELTAYSRSPEFNAFGRSRLFTTYTPLSLEGGPNYQQPFVFDPTGKFTGVNDPSNPAGFTNTEVLHLNSLLGTFGFGATVEDDDGVVRQGGNMINAAQIEMINGYLHRRWPGYDRSFADKYGGAECRQIALNAALYARMATTQIGTGNVDNFNKAYGARSTSVNFAPDETTSGGTPERMYWRFPEAGKNNGLYLPQTPGPHITEVRLFAKVTSSYPGQLRATDRVIQYWYEVEYYMHAFGPILKLKFFPTRMDYFEIRVLNAAGVEKAFQQFGPDSPDRSSYDSNWDFGALTNPIEKDRRFDPEIFDEGKLGRVNLRRMIVYPGSSSGATDIGPAGSSVPNRVRLTSKIFTVGEDRSVIPWQVPGMPELWKPKVFDSVADSAVTVEFRLRPGMSILTAPGRPRQMIPLGETRNDTLQAAFSLNLRDPNRDFAVSWQISDPRLSHDLSQWLRTGPGNPLEIGTPVSTVNNNEPGENSPEKSKFRYLLRAYPGSKIGGYEYDRPDEYDGRSRISSPGYWSLLHTGMQSGKPWRTLDFGAEGGTPSPLRGNDTSPPDWLFLDLIGATYPLANDQTRKDGRQPDEFSTASYMNSTAGQINLNSRIYPRTPYFNPPPRIRPLQAVFQYLPEMNKEKSVAAAAAIESYQADGKFFDYVGEVSNVPEIAGSGASPYMKEFALRNMAGVLTTKSNTFGVWGAAQIVKKIPANTGYGRFEKGDEVIAEKRFYALVERYIWPGRDGLPGNAHVSTQGKWDRLAQQAGNVSAGGNADTLFNLPGSPPLARTGVRLSLDPTGTYAPFDGPEKVGMNPFTEKTLGRVVFNESSLENAYNPPQALIKYRVVSFKYLDQ